MAEILRRKVQVPVLLLAVGVVLIVALLAVILLSGEDDPIQGNVIDGMNYERCIVVRYPEGFLVAQLAYEGVPPGTELLFQGATMDECIAFAQNPPG